GWATACGVEFRLAVARAMDDLVGRTLGAYELHELLGKGGVSAVFRAVDLRAGTDCALKLLRPELVSDQAFLVRFNRETTIAGALSHPGIIRTFEVGERDGWHYIAMELLRGVSLDRLIRDGGPLPPRRALRLLNQLAVAVDYAHGFGVVHRDLKPSNIYVGPSDRVTLLDFGLARPQSGTKITGEGMLIGTPEYMAPELLLGEPASPSADLYALGLVAYEALTGQRPFEAPDTHAMLYAHLYAAPRSPR